MLTIKQLKTGERPQASETEFARLRGVSRSTLQKERWEGKGVPFRKDPVTGRVSYDADTVIAFFDRAVSCTSTSDYETRSHQERLEKARTTLKEKGGR